MSATIRTSAVATAARASGPAARRLQPHGARLEVRRVLRNRRTVMFILVFPSLFFFMFGAVRRRSAAQAGGIQSPTS